jgi:hypothetical protein
MFTTSNPEEATMKIPRGYGPAEKVRKDLFPFKELAYEYFVIKFYIK